MVLPDSSSFHEGQETRYVMKWPAARHLRKIARMTIYQERTVFRYNEVFKRDPYDSIYVKDEVAGMRSESFSQMYCIWPVYFLNCLEACSPPAWSKRVKNKTKKDDLQHFKNKVNLFLAHSLKMEHWNSVGVSLYRHFSQLGCRANTRPLSTVKVKQIVVPSPCCYRWPFLWGGTWFGVYMY